MLAWNKVIATRDSRVTYIAAFASLSDIQATNQRIARWLWSGALCVGVSFAGRIF